MPILEDLALDSSIDVRRPKVALAAVLPLLRRSPPLPRIGPICVPVAVEQTDAAGRFEIAGETDEGNCGGLFLGVSADGFIARYLDGGIQCNRVAQTFDFELTPGTVPFSLIAPPNGTTVTQNDPTTSCTPHPTRGSGYRILFDWTDASGLGSASYRLRVVKPDELLALDLVVTESRFLYEPCDFVPDAIRTGWRWQVRFEGGGQVSEWSPPWVFEFEPCRLSDDTPCS